MKGGNGSAGAVGFRAINRNNECRPSIAFNDAACSNPDHAAVPAVAVDDNTECFAKHRVLRHSRVNGLNDSALLLLTFGVEFVEAQSNFSGLSSIFDAEKVDDFACD